MKNVNFDSLANIKAPEQWIENALNVPKTVDAEKAKPLFIIKHARTLAAVASLVFVSVISIVLFLSNDSVTPQIKPETQETKATISSVQADYSTQKDEKPTKPSKTENKNQDNTVKAPTENYEEIEPPESEHPQKPTTGSGDTEEPTQPTKPTTPIGPPKPTEPEVRPSSAPTEAPTEPPQESPSEPEYVEPTEGDDWNPGNPGAPSDPLEPGNPDYPPTVKPTIKPTEDTISNVTFTATVNLSFVSGGQSVYCKVYDSNNRLIGDSNEYSYQHQAGFLSFTETTATLIYYMPNGLITKHGTYSYYFYTGDGEILHYGSKYI